MSAAMNENPSYLGKPLFDSRLGTLLARHDRCEPGHLIGVVRRWLFVVFELPGVPLPPGGVQVMPEALSVSLPALHIGGEVAHKEVFPRTKEVSFWAPDLSRGILC